VKQRKQQKAAMEDLAKPREVKNKFTSDKYRSYLDTDDYGSVHNKGTKGKGRPSILRYLK